MSDLKVEKIPEGKEIEEIVERVKPWDADLPKIVFTYPKMPRSAFHATVKSMIDGCSGDEIVGVMRALTQKSLFYFVIYILGWTFLDNDFAYALCGRVQNEGRWGTMWLLSREHYKSTIITIGETIRDILLHPTKTTCIYSYKYDSAKDLFFTPVKNELEQNELIRMIWPDVVYLPNEKPDVWTTTSINVKGHQRRKEFTLTCASIYQQLTGSHYDQLVFDDCVIEENCQTADRIEQTQKQWELSLNTGNTKDLKYCIIGTFYAYGDLYCHIRDEKLCKTVIQPCYDANGVPVLYTQKALEEKRRILGTSVFATQMLLDPKLGSVVSFREEDLMYWPCKVLAGLNVYTFVDPAGEVARHRDNTVILTIGLDSADNFYIIDMIRDKLTLTQKTNELFRIKRQYNPRIVFYEKNGAAIDVPHIQQEMDRYNFRFPIQTITQNRAKGERIESLIPLFEAHRIYLPENGCWHTNWEGKSEDMLHSFIIEEYLAYPHTTHDDAIDDLANILHPSCQNLMQRPDSISMEEEIYNKLHAKGMSLTPFRDDEGEYDPLGAYRPKKPNSPRGSEDYRGKYQSKALDQFVQSYSM